eukprot:TRINITY_DN5057_c0_g1_i1.p1 TRINITY_DN5057_c0_g1~~TRINITY_DN5057_c0_g1_i1.p1  ORF type:complete len:210 (+),score=40.18 TRINITY_DN5057_c0_g1_i1:347-976(+)
MREADVLCDNIGIMAEGNLLVEGTPVELKQRYGVGYELICVPNAHRVDEFDEMANKKDLEFPDGSLPKSQESAYLDSTFEKDNLALQESSQTLIKSLGLHGLEDICEITAERGPDGIISFAVGANKVDYMAKICKYLEDCGKFASISVSATSLEDVFLKLAEQQNRAELKERRSMWLSMNAKQWYQRRVHGGIDCVFLIEGTLKQLNQT